MQLKVRPFILGHLLISQTVLEFSRRRFCRKFQFLSLINKNELNYRNKRGEILKVLRAQLFPGNPLF